MTSDVVKHFLASPGEPAAPALSLAPPHPFPNRAWAEAERRAIMDWVALRESRVEDRSELRIKNLELQAQDAQRTMARAAEFLGNIANGATADPVLEATSGLEELGFLQPGAVDKLADERADNPIPVDALRAQLAAVHFLIDGMRREYGEVGSRDEEVARWNVQIQGLQRAIPTALAAIEKALAAKALDRLTEPAFAPLVSIRTPEAYVATLEAANALAAELKRSVDAFAARLREAGGQ